MSTKLRSTVILLLVVTLGLIIGNYAQATAAESPEVRVVHLAPFAAVIEDTAVTVTLNGDTILEDVQYKDFTDYIPLPAAGNYDVAVVAGGSTIISDTLTVEEDKQYTVTASGEGINQTPQFIVLEDDNSDPDTGEAKLRLVHAAPFGNNHQAEVDICLQDETPILEKVNFGQNSGYLELPAGEYDLRITKYNSHGPCQGNTLIDIAPVTLTAGSITTAFAIGDNNNQPLSALTIPGGELPIVTTEVRFVHIAPFASDAADTLVSIDVQDERVLSNVAYSQFTEEYLTFAGEGQFKIELFAEAAHGAEFLEIMLDLEGGEKYTIAAIGDQISSLHISGNRDLDLFVLQDNETPPAAGEARLRIAHAASFAPGHNGEVDICTQDGQLVSDLQKFPYEGDSGYLDLPAGMYDLQIRDFIGLEQPCEGAQVFDIPPFMLNAGDIITAYAIGNNDEQPIDILFIPGGLLSTIPTPPAQVKIAHLAPFAHTMGGTAVTILIDGEEQLTGFEFGDITDYLELDAPAQYDIQVKVGNLVVIDETATVAAGQDYTIGAIGDGINQPLELLILEDDNSEPAAGDTHVRIVHAAPFAANLADTQVDICTQDGTLVGGLSGVPYKGNSGYLPLPAGSYDLKVVADGGADCSGLTLIDPPALDLADGAITTVFAVGDINFQPVGIVADPGSFIPVNKPQVKVAHLAPFADTVDGTAVTVTINGGELLTDFKFGDITNYVELDNPGSYDIEVKVGDTVAISGTATVAAGQEYTIGAIGDGVNQPLELLILEDDNSAPAAGNTHVRIIHAAPFAADLDDTRVDVCTQDGTLVGGLSGVPYKGNSGYLPLPAAIYDLKIVADGGDDCSGQTLIDPPALDLANGTIATVFAVGDITNQPVGVVTDPAGLTPVSNPRVKVAHLAPFADTVDGTAVTVTVNGGELLTDFKFGDITDYVELEGAGSYDLEVKVGDTVAISGTATVMAGQDYTIGAIGDGVNQPLELLILEDDNSEPAAGNTHVRIVHTAPFAADLAATQVDICTQDGVLVGGLSGVPYKGNSGYLPLPAGSYDLKVVADGGDDCSGLTLIDPPALDLADGAITTVFAIGDLANQPVGLVADPGGLIPVNKPRVKVAHLAPFADSIENTAVSVTVNGGELLNNFQFGDITDYVELDNPGAYDIEVKVAGVVAISGTATVAAGQDYTIGAIGDGINQPLELLILEDDNSEPAAGNTHVRIVHAAPFAADIVDTQVDICTQDGILVGGLSGVPYKGNSGYLPLPAGSYDLKVVADGRADCSGLTLIDPPAFDLADGAITTVFAVGDITHLPVGLVTDPGGFIDVNQPRVKVAHLAPFAIEANTAVTVTVNGAVLLTDFVFGDITEYVELANPGAYDIEVLVGGTVAISGTATVAAGQDYTIGAIGDGTNQPLELLILEDDNSIPAAGNAHLRVVHAAPFAADLVDTQVDICTQDGTLVGGLSGVPYKGVSGYLQLPAGDYDLKIVADGGDDCSGATLIDPDTLTLVDGSVSTVFAVGDGTNIAPGVVFNSARVSLVYQIFTPIILAPES